MTEEVKKLLAELERYLKLTTIDSMTRKNILAIVKSHLKGKVIVDENDLLTGDDHKELVIIKAPSKAVINKLKKLSQPKDERTSEHSEDKTRKESGD